MEKLNERKVPAMAFFHMPPAEFKEAYEKMKLGDHSVIYEHGSHLTVMIAEYKRIGDLKTIQKC